MWNKTIKLCNFMHTYTSSRKEIEHKSDDWFILLVILQLYYLANADNLKRN